MQNTHLVTFTVAFGFAATMAAAQAGGQSDRSDPSSRQITVSGCLQRNATGNPASGTTTTSATVGTTGAQQFVLIKGSTDPSNSEQWHSDKPNGPWYFLVGDTEQLRHDDAHMIEVKGTLDAAKDAGGAAASTTSGPSGTIHITEIKVLSSRCGE